MVDLDSLLEKAKWDTLSNEELQYVIESIYDPGEYDIYTLLLILGRGGTEKYRHLVEKFLSFEEDPQVTALSLRILCQYWELYSIYIDWIKKYMHGVSWDEDNEIRLEVISLAGEYLRQNKDNKLTEQLLNIYDDLSHCEIIRRSAYFALARAQGKNWSELPSAAKTLNFQTDIDQKVIEAGRKQVCSKSTK